MGPNDLLIVGAGQLGCRVAHMWRDLFSDAKIYLMTQTHNEERATKWKNLGFETLTASEDAAKKPKCPYVVFSAPPTNTEKYGEAVKEATLSTATDGIFVFTSSGGVYEENSGGVVDETSPTAPSERSTKILEAEKAAAEAKGVIIRLGALITKAKGPHNFWLSQKEVSTCANGYINLIHYDEAAEAVMKALTMKLKDELFLVSDGMAMTRKQISAAGLKHEMFKDKAIPEFKGDPNKVDGRKYNIKKFQGKTGWKPKYGGFEKFMTEDSEEMKVPLLN